MWSWLKKKPSCRHDKGRYEGMPPNLKDVVRFSEVSAWPRWAVVQCDVCGKRMFAGSGFHMFALSLEKGIDDFITYKIELPELIGILEKWCKTIELGETK